MGTGVEAGSRLVPEPVCCRMVAISGLVPGLVCCICGMPQFFWWLPVLFSMPGIECFVCLHSCAEAPHTGWTEANNTQDESSRQTITRKWASSGHSGPQKNAFHSDQGSSGRRDI